MLRRSIPRVLFPLICISLAFAACSDDDGGSGPTPGPDGTEDIGAAGGSVTSEDGAFKLTVPAGALATTQTISIEALDPATLPSAFDGLRVEAAYEIEPSGLTFSAPVTVEFTSGQTAFPAADAVDLIPETIFTVDDVGALEALAAAEMVADASTGTLTILGETEHFSPFVCISERDFETGDPYLRARFDLSRNEDPSRFAVNVRLDYDAERSAYALPISVQSETDPADATPAGMGSYSFDVSDFGQGTTAEHEIAYGCVRSGVINVAIRGSFERKLGGSQGIRVNLRTECTEPDDPGPGEAFEIQVGAGVELTKTLRLSTKEWDDRPVGEFDYLLTTGTFATQIWDLSLKAVAFDVHGDVQSQFYGALAVEALNATGDFTSGVVSYGPMGGLITEYAKDSGFDNFAQGFGFQNGVWDAVNAGTDAFTFVEGGTQAKGQYYDDKGNLNALFSPIFSSQLDGGSAGEFRGIVHARVNFKPRRAPGDLLMITSGIEGPGKIFVGDSANPFANLISVGSVGTDPRRLRFVDGIAAVSNFGSDDLTVMTWDGATVTVTEQSVPVGDGPVGIDLIRLSNGNTAISSTGFNDDTYSITVVDANGDLVSNQSFPVPFEGTAPGHATWTRKGSEIWIVVSCSASGNVVLIPTELQ